MVKRLIFALGCLAVLSLPGCQLTSELVDMPLSSDELLLVGHWQHVHGIGNVWNWEFSEQDRGAHHFSSNLIWGSVDVYYHWAATTTEVIIYERDKSFAKEHARYTYSFASPEVLVLEGSEYELQ